MAPFTVKRPEYLFESVFGWSVDCLKGVVTCLSLRCESHLALYLIGIYCKKFLAMGSVLSRAGPDGFYVSLREGKDNE